MGAATAAGASVVATTASRAAAKPAPRGKYEALVPELFRPVRPPRQHSEAIVIGSGFGGSVSALRLAEAGIQTTVLERGSRWPHDPRRDIFGGGILSGDGRSLWHAQRALVEKSPVSTTAMPGYAEALASMAAIDDFGGATEITWHNNTGIMCGAALGGGSVIYIGIKAQSERRPFDAVFKGTVNYDEMASTWYPKALAALGATSVPADVYRHNSFNNARDLERVGARAGYGVHRIPGNWRWDVVRDEIGGRSRPSTIIGESGGSSNGSLNSLTYSYIPRAEATGKASFHPRHQVNAIHQEKSGRYVLDVDYLSPYGEVLRRSRLTTDRLIVAAGCLGTNRLLVRARHTSTLPDLNEHIGTNWGDNGNGNVHVAVASPKTQQSSVGAVGFMDYGGTIARGVINSTYALGPLDAAGAALKLSAMKIGITSVDHTKGTFRYQKGSGQVVLDWPANGNDDVVANCMRIAHRLAERSGVVAGPVVNEPVIAAAHCLGGAPLNAACDSYGRVKGYKNLYVNDGALLPGSAGASNPSLTITALAERNIAHIIANGG